MNNTCNSIRIREGQTFYAIGYRNGYYPPGEYYVKFSAVPKNVSDLMMGQEARLHPEYKIWEFKLSGVPIAKGIIKEPVEYIEGQGKSII